MKSDEVMRPGETVDALFDGKVQLVQSRKGYRFSLDAVLLSHFVALKPEQKVMDLGTGNGVVALLLAYLNPSVSITGIEIQPLMANRAWRNVRLNHCEKKIVIVCGDVRTVEQICGPASFDVVVCNPPYRKPASGRLSAHDERRIARHEIKAQLADFMRAGVFLLPAQGSMAVIYPAVRAADLLDTMKRAGIEPKRVRMVHSFAHTEATLILVEGKKGGRGGMKILAPLVVYEKGHRYTPEVRSLLAGEASGVTTQDLC